jgi:hypothetical protein
MKERQDSDGNASAKSNGAPILSPTLASDRAPPTYRSSSREEETTHQHVKLKDISTGQAGH